MDVQIFIDQSKTVVTDTKIVDAEIAYIQALNVGVHGTDAKYRIAIQNSESLITITEPSFVGFIEVEAFDSEEINAIYVDDMKNINSTYKTQVNGDAIISAKKFVNITGDERFDNVSAIGFKGNHYLLVNTPFEEIDTTFPIFAPVVEE